MPEPKQEPTPEKTPRPKNDRSNSDASQDDQGYESRSRSQSRRRRRQNQRQRQSSSKAQSGNASAESQTMGAITEQAEQDDDHPSQQVAKRTPQEADKPQWLQDPDVRDITETQPFDYIKPPSQSMDGPVSYARMIRGEIPWRGPPPSQPIESAKPMDSKDSGGKDPMDQDGLKLRIELNLDIEIELKAHIHGDLTLALL